MAAVIQQAAAEASRTWRTCHRFGQGSAGRLPNELAFQIAERREKDPAAAARTRGFKALGWLHNWCGHYGGDHDLEGGAIDKQRCAIAHRFLLEVSTFFARNGVQSFSHWVCGRRATFLMLQTAPTISVLRSKDGAPKCLHGSGIDTLPQLTSDEKTRLMVSCNHSGIKPGRLSDYLKDLKKMDSLDIIHQNPHEYHDGEEGLTKRREVDGS